MWRVLTCAIVVFSWLPTTFLRAQALEQQVQRSTALFSLDGSVLAIAIDAHDASVVELRSAGEYKLLHMLTDGEGAMESLAFSPDGKELAAGGRDGNVYVWSVATGRLLQTLVSRRESKEAVAYLPDGSGLVALACEFRDERARTWMTTWNRDGKLENVRQIEGASALANSIPFSNGDPQMRRNTKAGSQLLAVPLVDAPVQAIDSPLPIVISAIPTSDGRKIVIAGGTATPTADGKGRWLSPGLVVLDTKTNEVQRLKLEGDGDYSRALAVDSDGSIAYFAWPGPWISPAGQPGLREATKLLSAWDFERNKTLWTSEQKFDGIRSIARGPKGRDLICCDFRGVWLVDAENGKVVRELRKD